MEFPGKSQLDEFRKYSVPIFRSNRGRPQIVGTGFFLQAGDSSVLVSARHVLWELKSENYFIYITAKIAMPLTGSVSCFSKTSAGVDIDIGILSPHKDITADPRCSFKVVSSSCTRPNLLPRTDYTYALFGFPESRSKVDPLRRAVNSKLYSYSSQSQPKETYASLGLEFDSHICMKYDPKDGYDAHTGKHQNLPKPQGFSGAPIWVIGQTRNSPELEEPCVVGVATKHLKEGRSIYGADIRYAEQLYAETLLA